MKTRLLSFILLSSLLLTLFFGNRSSVSSQPNHQIIDLSVSIDQVLASGFSSPVQVTHANDSSGRMFVVEQTGRIKIIHSDRTVTLFLDISSRLTSGGERGLLGLAFHPDYATNGYFYIDYTNLAGNTVVARFSTSTDANVANPNSELILFTVDQPYSNHNGGQVLFGPDGYLYISLGDGGSGGDPQNNAQNLSTPLGKILRIDVNQGSPYTIPTDNPFYNSPNADKRIWVWGLRNPWRFSFDRLTGDMFIGDVGQNLWEEIDFQSASSVGGENYGWRCLEGTHTYSTSAPCNSSAYLQTLIPPISEYAHSTGRSVSGGFVYRGTLYPDFEGVYFFADYVDGKIFSLQKSGNVWEQTLELSSGLLISGFGENEAGELFLVDYGGGTIRQVSDPNVPSANLADSNIAVNLAQANPGEVLTYTITISNSGLAISQQLNLLNTLPEKVTFLVGTLTATAGHAAFNNGQVSWNGSIGSQTEIQISYQALIDMTSSGSIVNLFTLSGIDIEPIQRHAITSVPGPLLNTTANDFILPGTQPGIAVPLVDSIDCKTCHSPEIYDAWRGSPMSQAGRDPLMWAALFNANAKVPEAGEFCLRCHTPNGWLSNRSSDSSGASLFPQDIRNGVSCQLCHRMVDPIATAGDSTNSIDIAIRAALQFPPPGDYRSSAMYIIDPQDRRRGPFVFSPQLPYHATYQTGLLSQSQNAWKESSLCGTCHNIDNPVLSWDEGQAEYLPNAMDSSAPQTVSGALYPIERTFDEWSFSDYASSGVFAPQFAGQKADGIVRSCQDCHMPRATGRAALDPFNPVYRDCTTSGCLTVHSFPGVNTWLPDLLQNPDWRLSAISDSQELQYSQAVTTNFLQKAASLEVQLIDHTSNKTARVIVTNQTGHKLPTGYPEGRRMWINLRAYNSDGSIVYESGAYDFITHDLILDADIKVYESKQAISPALASILGVSGGESFEFVLNNSVVKDNRIPPRGILVSEYASIGLQSVGAVYSNNQFWDISEFTLPAETSRVTAKLYYQVASKEYIQFLINNGGYDGFLLQSIWNTTPSDPVLMEIAFDPAYVSGLPLIFK